MLCALTRLELDVRRIWCIGGPDMPIEEVSFHVGYSPKVLRALLGHVPKLSYYTIRDLGLERLFDLDSTEGRALGFLADGDPFEVLRLDRLERERMRSVREALLAAFNSKKLD